MKNEFYDVKHLLVHSACYYMIFGERSNGKTTSVLSYILEEFIKSNYKKQGALIRRWTEDFKGVKGQQMCETLVSLGYVEKWSNKRYNTILYNSHRWYLAKVDKEGKKLAICDLPFLYAFSLSSEEHYKSTSYPNIKNILFDEFITRDYYLPDEFVIFQNLLSTIIREKDDVKIFMCGNTINKYNVYFSEMGLNNASKMKQGDIDIYTYGDSDLKVVVEYCESKNKNKKSNKYFAFDNPKLKMIRNGAWEISIYPHLPYKYNSSEKMFSFYINFEKRNFECEVINKNSDIFIYIHRKTSDIIETDYPVYSFDIVPNYNYSTNIFNPRNKIESLIKELFVTEKVFYQDNEVGEDIRNFLMFSSKK